MKEKHIRKNKFGSYRVIIDQRLNNIVTSFNKTYSTLEEAILIRDMYLLEFPYPKLRTYPHKKHPLYNTWADIMKRTGVWKSNNKRIKNMYLDKGIDVSQEWKESFETFVKDMGERPTKRHHIDRTDNSKGYSKQNCRWVTREVSMFNQSRYTSTRKSKLPRGVNKNGNLYSSCIGIEGINYYLGSFKTILEAQKAYETMALEWYGFLPKNKIAK